MATTIQINERTKQLLEMLKKREHKESYDALIQEIVTNLLKAPKTLFGCNPSLKKWDRNSDRIRFNEN